MRALVSKEIRGFLGTLIGQITITVFLLLTGLFTWVFPGNILDTGYADLVPLFSVVPWVLLFLVPAVTMRSFSEERRTGTMELLLTRPISELRIVLAKYAAALLLTTTALLPTLFYWWSVGDLAVPRWNLDGGGILGSYIGLFLLASCFTAIGIFASALSESQVVAFLIAAFLCFILLSGFSMLASFDAFGAWEGPIKSLGMQSHYDSLSRGVVDLRDVLWFLGVDAIFILATRTVLKSHTW
jgi:ABC-2 type transport system permease protein